MSEDKDTVLVRAKKKRGVKKGKDAYHSYVPMYHFRPFTLPMKYSNDPNVEVRAPETDWGKLSLFFRNMSTDGIDVTALAHKLEEEDAAAAAGPAKVQSGKAKKEKELSKSEKIILANQIKKEEEGAKADIARLTQNAQLENVVVKSATGRIALNMCLIVHHWAAGRRAEALDIWLDLGYDKKSLVGLVASEEDYVQTPGGFVFPEHLEGVYERCVPKLKEFLKWFTIVEAQDMARYQLEDMGDRLIPLNYRLFKEHKLDEWQKRALRAIRSKESVLICAPTSAGKTLISTFTLAHLAPGKTIVMAVPSAALALQVASMFMYSQKDCFVCVVCDQLEVVDDDKRPRIIVGTPDELETLIVTGLRSKILSKRPLDVEALVIDEIHNLNKSAAMERLIHLLPEAYVLGLSATVGNAERLHSWLQYLKKGKTVHLEKVSQRFFNLQQHYFDVPQNRLVPLSPLAVISPESLETAAKSDIPFTPRETVRLYEAIKPHLRDERKAVLEPKSFFASRMARDKVNRLTLGQAREYGHDLVMELCALGAAAKADVFKKFALNDIPTDVDLPRLVKSLGSGQLPALAFSLDAVKSSQAFYQLLHTLEEDDQRANPGRRARLQKQQRQYEKALKLWLAGYDRIDSDERREEYERTNPRPEPTVSEDSLDPRYVIGPPKVGEEQIKELWQSLDESVGISEGEKYRSKMAPFMAPYIEGLRRGIACYTRYMPVFYLRHVQRLAQNGELGFIISDDSLAHGVNMPFRTVVFVGDHERLTPSLAQQMAGRAGRRGLDRAGHVIYMGLTQQRVKELISGALPDITGTTITSPAVCAMALFRPTPAAGDKENELKFDSTLFDDRRRVALMGMFCKGLALFGDRNADEEARHKAACDQRARDAIAVARTVAPEYQRLLFDLRESPLAFFVGKALLPSLLTGKWPTLRSGVDAETVQTYRAFGRFLEQVPGEKPWEKPEDAWAVAILEQIQAIVAKEPALLPANQPAHTDESVCQVFTQNSVVFKCVRPSEARPAGPASQPASATLSVAPAATTSAAAVPDGASAVLGAATPTPSTTPAMSVTPVPSDAPASASEAAAAADGPAIEGEEEAEGGHDLETYLDNLAVADARAESVTVTALAAMDVRTLYALKDRLWAVSHVLLPVRNECARHSWETQLWTESASERKRPYNEWERTEILLRVMHQRLFWILLEAPF